MQCIVCSNSDSRPRGNYTDPLSHQRYVLYGCAACGLEFWDPRGEDRNFYERERSSGYDTFHRGEEIIRPAHEIFLSSQPKPGDRLLDIGCGNGSFLRRARALGYEVWGLDFDQRSVEVARTRFGLENVYAVSLQELRRDLLPKGAPFQAITFFEVLEHLECPTKFLKEVCDLLEPGGRVAGSVPNGDRVFARFDRKATNHDTPPHHFTYWTEASLMKFLTASGFAAPRLERTDQLTLPRMVAEVESVVVLPTLYRALRRARSRSRVSGSGGKTAVAAAESSVRAARTGVAWKAARWARTAMLAPLTVPLSAAALIPYNRRGKTLFFETRHLSNEKQAPSVARETRRGGGLESR